MLLLYAPDLDGGAVPGPRRAAGAVGVQFLPQPGFELHRMQFAERRKAGGRFSPPPLPRGPLERRRTRRPSPRPRRPRLRQARAFFAWARQAAPPRERPAQWPGVII